MDGRLAPVRAAEDVLETYRGTPVEALLLAQNLGREFPVGAQPALLVATCMDSRVRLELPPGAAFELRSAGVRMDRHAHFQVAYAVAVAGVRAVAVVAHDDCAMTRLASQEREIVRGLERTAGWSAAEAEALFREHVELWRRDDPIAAAAVDTRALRERFPGLTVAPLLYAVGDRRLRQIDEASAADG